MSDPVLTFVLIALFVAVVIAARWFRTLEGGVPPVIATASATGLVCGIPLLAADRFPGVQPAVTGILLTSAAIYLRHVGEESEPGEGMLAGALTGAAAVVPVAIFGSSALQLFTGCILAGSVAGYGITAAALHVRDRIRQLLVDFGTAALAIVVAAAALATERVGIAPRTAALAAAAAIPLLSIAGVFFQSREVLSELAHEAALGFIDDSDVRRAAHPLLRFGRGGWTDAGAHREFVRIANKLALRQRLQRDRPDAIARLYQLEIIKLRMQLQEMTRIGRSRRDSPAQSDDLPSDRMHA